MRLGEQLKLGELQQPVRVRDTSALVAASQRDIAYITADHQAREILQGRGDEDGGWEEVYLTPIVLEYAAFCIHQVMDEQHGIPKFSETVRDEVDLERIIELPPEIKSRLGTAKKLWEQISRKTQSDKKQQRDVQAAVWPSTVSYADLNVVAFALEQAANNRECIVYAFDYDISDPVRKIAEKEPHIHLAEPRLETLESIAEREGYQEKPILITRAALGQLWRHNKAQQVKGAQHYLVVAKQVPFAGNEVEVITGVRQAEGRLRDEPDAERRRVVCVDLDVYRMATQPYQREMFKRRFERALIENVKAQSRDEKKHRLMVAALSNNAGELVMGQEDSTELREKQWVMVDNPYLQRFAPETLEYLNAFRARTPR